MIEGFKVLQESRPGDNVKALCPQCDDCVGYSLKCFLRSHLSGN